jgi:hypothetical protein
MNDVQTPTRSLDRAFIPLAIAVGIAMALYSGAAVAVETIFTGYSDGCFATAPCVPPTTPTTATQSITFNGLTYNNSTFNVTTAAGFVAIGNAPGTPNVDNLGSFTLTGTPFVYNGEHFDLRVTFTAPPSTAPGTVIFSDVITGTVNSVDNGGIFVDLDNTMKHFTFGSGSTAGSFDFFVNDVSLTAGHSIAVTGTILAQVSTVPEPASFVLLVGGLGALAFVAHRRRL